MKLIQSAIGALEGTEALVTSPAWLTAEAIGRFLPEGKEERRLRMAATARHESGHALVGLLMEDCRIERYHVSSLSQRTLSKLRAAFGRREKRFVPHFTGGFVRFKFDQEDHEGKAAERLFYNSLGGLAAEPEPRGMPADFNRRWFDATSDFDIPREGIRQVAPHWSDKRTYRVIREMMEEIRSVFWERPFQTGIDALTAEFIRKPSDAGAHVHASLLGVLGAAGITHKTRAAMMRRLDRVNLGQMLAREARAGGDA